MKVRRATRRAAVLLLAGSLLVAACGGDDDDGSAADPGNASTTAGLNAPGDSGPDDDVDPNGVLRIYYDLIGNGGPDFDPIKVRVSPAVYVQTLVYGSLFKAELDGTLKPHLADSFEIVDPSTVKVTLKPNLQFSDGTPLDAEAAKFSILRTRDAQKENSTLAAEVGQISDVTVESPTEFTIHLATPVAGAIVDRFPFGEFFMVSPTAVQNGVNLSETPVGAGPFLLDRVEPGRRFIYKKNPNYFAADEVRLAGVEVLHVEAGQARVNAIQSNAVDVSDNLSYEQSKALASTTWEVHTEVTDNVMFWGQVCKSRPPFDDVRVRQALNYAIDRDAINQAVFDGKGEPMWGFYASNSPLHDPSLDNFYPYDPEKAKALLAEAGQEDLRFETFFTPGASQRMVEIMQAQLGEIGVTLTPKPLTQAADFFPDAKGAPVNVFGLERQGIQKVARNLVPGSVGNVCNWDHAELNDLVNQLRALDPSAPEAVELWHQLQRLTLEEAMNWFGVFGMRATAYNPDRVGDAYFVSNFQGRPEPDFTRIYIRK